MHRIRGKSLNKGNIRMYITYGLGELVLVIAGILIALQVNNWSEGRKTEKLELRFLEKLQKDLISDSIYFTQRIMDAESAMEDFYRFVHEAYEIQRDVDEYKRVLPLDWPSQNMIIENSTYEELKNTAQLNIFKNSALKDQIISYYKDCEAARIHISELNTFTQAELYSIHRYITKYHERFSYLFDQEYMFENADWEYINNPDSETFKKVEVTAAVYSYKHDLLLDHFSRLLIQTRMLIEMIDDELMERG